MIQEIVNFTQSIDEEFKSLGTKPKEGIHILVRKKIENQISSIDFDNLEYEIFSKKSKDQESDFLNKCKVLHQNAWCINTNKCFDAPTKAIHSCSPFCVAFKKEHIEGGDKFKKNEEENKSQIYDRFGNYFEKAFPLFKNDEKKEPFMVFMQFFTDNKFSKVLEKIDERNSFKRQQINGNIEQLKEYQKEENDKARKDILKKEIAVLEQKMLKFKELEDSDYIIFYLDVPLEYFQNVHKKYLDDKLFNKNKFNTKPNEEGLIFGTSDFLNGFNSNMPFLMHQTASFDITGRISNIQAKQLYDFIRLLPNKTLPSPLPIFIYKEELQQKVIGMFKEQGNKVRYKEIIETLAIDYKEDIGNYYLLFWNNTKDGIVFKDFDFVSKFEYEVRNVAITNYFGLKKVGGKEDKNYPLIKNIFDFENIVFKPLIQNKYHRLDYFGDLKKDDYEKLDQTFISYCKYRKAIYDFVYKSQRQAVQLSSFDEMTFNGIKDDIKQARVYGIKEKLNIWYSLHDMFNPNKNEIKMASKLQNYRDFVARLIADESDTEQATDQQFAFTAGQVIDYILGKSKSADKSYQLLEPYLQQSKCAEFKKAIANDFSRYKHENFSRNFERACAFVLSYETGANLKHLLPEILSGVFSNNQLYSTKSNQDNQ